MTPGDRLDITEQVISNPIDDDEVIGGEGDRVVVTLASRQRLDPRGELVVPHHLSEVREQMLPVIHRSTLA
jgi:hypothetical protein